MVWATPQLDDRHPRRRRGAMGGTHHPFLGFLGVMSAKNTAVNLMILTTFLSFLLYRRANREPTVSWATHGDGDCSGLPSPSRPRSSSLYGVYGYFVESIVRIGFSVYQVRGGPGLHRRRDGDRHPDVQGRALDRDDPLGHDRAPLAVRPDPPRRDVHLADGPDGLRPLRDPPALARLRRHARHVARGGDAGARLRGQRDHASRPSLFLALVMFIFWLGGLGEKGTPRPRRSPACTLPPRRSAAEAGRARR